MKREDDWDEVLPPPNFTPSKEWLEAFQGQYNETLVHFAAEYVDARRSGIGSRHPQDKRYPYALVLRVLTDTMLGIHRWDHTTRLVDHLQSILRSHSKIAWKRARKRPERRYPHLRIDETKANGRSPVLDELDRIGFELLTDREKASLALTELRERAGADPELASFISAYCYEGSRAEVLRETGLSEDQYRQVRRRLVQLLKELSIEARPQQDSKERTP